LGGKQERWLPNQVGSSHVGTTARLPSVCGAKSTPSRSAGYSLLDLALDALNEGTGKSLAQSVESLFREGPGVKQKSGAGQAPSLPQRIVATERLHPLVGFP
jgi:hypothetical protein